MLFIQIGGASYVNPSAWDIVANLDDSKPYPEELMKNFYLTSEQDLQQGEVLVVNYSFPIFESKEELRLLTSKVPQGKFASMSLQAKGTKNASVSLRLSVRDSNGEYFYYNGPNIDWEGWKEINFDFSDPYLYVGGSEAGKGEIDFPLTQIRLRITKNKNSTVDMSKLYLSNFNFSMIGIDSNIESVYPVLSVGRFAKPPVIDGNLDEKVWSVASQIPVFFEKTPDKLSYEKTIAKLGYDDQYLYVGFILYDRIIKCLEAEELERDGPVWVGDAVEIVLENTYSEAFHFIVNAKGSIYDSKAIDGLWNQTWDSSLRAEVATFSDRWQVEIAIPLEDLNINTTNKNSIKANFIRAHREGRHCQWSPTPAHPNRAVLGELIFSDFNSISWQYDIPNLIYGENIFDGTIISDDVRNLKAEILMFYDDGTNISFVKNLEGEKISKYSFPFKIEKRGNVRVKFNLWDETNGCLLHSSPVMLSSIEKLVSVELDQFVYYLEEGKYTLTFNISETISSTLGYSIQVLVNDITSNRELHRQMFNITTPYQYRLQSIESLKKLGLGKFIVTVSLLDPNKKIVDTDKQNLWVIPYQEQQLAPIQKVEIDEYNRVLVNGNPFLATNIYTVNMKEYEMAKYYGFNVAMAGWYPLEEISKQLTAAEEANIYLNIGLTNRGYGKIIAWDTAPKKIEAFRNHPNLFLWHWLDEPYPETYPEVEKAYSYLSGLDPNHPQYLATSANIYFKSNSRELVSGISDICDIIAPNIYAIPKRPLTDISNALDLTMEFVKGKNKSINFVLGTTQYVRGGNLRMPTPEETRAMSFLALLHGAKGLSFYTFGGQLTGKGEYGLRHDPHLLSYMKALNQELHYLAPVLLSINERNDYLVDSDVSSKLLSYNGDYYLVTVNPYAVEISTTFEGLDSFESVERFDKYSLSWQDSFSFNDGKLQVTYSPYAVHIFILK